MAYIPSLRENVSIVINAKADTKDVHVLSTDLQEDVSTILRYGRKRVMIENSYKDANQLGFGEYRCRKSQAALIHAHLVFLAYILIQILRYRLLSYRITKAVPSMEFVITKENYTGIHPLHMGQIKTRNINTFVNNDC